MGETDEHHLSRTNTMKINKISKKLIKPHIPTPPNLKNSSISFVDKNLAPMNIAVVLYYQLQSKQENDVDSQLEESLAKILVQFYLLAGRYIKSDDLVECSDQGVEFVVAEALELMEKTTHDHDLLPDQYFRLDEAPSAPLMSIQATHFPCGGLTIAISISHRVFDISSLGTFIAAWSTLSTNPDHDLTKIHNVQSFHLPSLLPCKELDIGIPKSDINDMIVPPATPGVVVRRLVFNKAAITSLKSKIRPRNGGKPVSGVRVVCAVITKAMIKLDTAKHGRSRDFTIFQPVNMRERTLPPVSKHACGNLSLTSLTQRVEASEAKEMGVEEIVDLIGDAVRKTIADHAQILSPDVDGRDIITNYLVELIKLYMNPEMNIIIFSDWSKFGFYEADFGWGKPVWTSIGPLPEPLNKATVLMSDKEGDGIEAWVHLNEQDMSCFDQDEEIKLFTT